MSKLGYRNSVNRQVAYRCRSRKVRISLSRILGGGRRSTISAPFIAIAAYPNRINVASIGSSGIGEHKNPTIEIIARQLQNLFLGVARRKNDR
ncbi:hypothetical protein NEOLI_004711 [Neolecta irregularis DAH-3]|uniref:Uncharacterized protein n=1 Tax=Neolecta irregularis (strain DAH-3) TaxID=1198029 RepID=A0A1U7LS70_NEOID|nr:hypothetical protein NEOLI_004711 [Neolecta irregularis DAH-3]|eukprot:OLL25520.1 hypothetical protein NEOLI_004711 [Neolecta irregularis DAH-3]